MKPKRIGSLAVLALAAVGAISLTVSRVVAVEAAYPVENAAHAFTSKVWTHLTGLFNGSVACAENVRLRREVASLSMLRGDVERLETENARLRRALDYVAKAPEKWVAAEVLSSGGGAAGTRKTLRVGKGSLAGVKEGSLVVVPEGLVGRVVSVTPHTSEVLLITDASLKVACEIKTASPEKLYGILSGGSDDMLVLKHLTGAGKAVPRARVLTSGRGGIFPSGIEVGTLLDVRRNAKGLAREAEVSPDVEYSTLEDVFIRREK